MTDSVGQPARTLEGKLLVLPADAGEVLAGRDAQTEVLITDDGAAVAVLMSTARRNQLQDSSDTETLRLFDEVLDVLNDHLGTDSRLLGIIPKDVPRVLRGLLSYTELDARDEVAVLEEEVDRLTGLLDAVAVALQPTSATTSPPPRMLHADLPVRAQVLAARVLTAEQAEDEDVAQMQLATVKMELASLREANRALRAERDAALARFRRVFETQEMFRRTCVLSMQLVNELRLLLDLPEDAPPATVLTELKGLLSQYDDRFEE